MDSIKKLGERGSDVSAKEAVSTEVSAEPKAWQEHKNSGSKKRGLESQDPEEGRGDQRPIKRLRDAKRATIAPSPAVSEAASQNDLQNRGMNDLPTETFALLGAFQGLNDLREGTRNVTKMRLVGKGLNSSVDRSPGLKKVEPTLHAVELTKRLIERAHTKRKDEDDFLEYSATDGNGEPDQWSESYLSGHVQDIYAVMKFSDPRYNSALLRAALKQPTPSNMQSRAQTLYQFAVNAQQFGHDERKTMIDASVEILESGTSGQVPAAKAFLSLKEQTGENEPLRSHIDSIERLFSDRKKQDPDFRRVFRRAEEERALSPESRVNSDAGRKHDDLFNFRDAAAYGSSHQSEWERFRTHIAKKTKETSEVAVLSKAITGLREAGYDLKTEHVAYAVLKRFYDAISYREAEKLLTNETREISSATEKRAALLERSTQREGRAD